MTIQFIEILCREDFGSYLIGFFHTKKLLIFISITFYKKKTIKKTTTNSHIPLYLKIKDSHFEITLLAFYWIKN